MTDAGDEAGRDRANPGGATEERTVREPAPSKARALVAGGIERGDLVTVFGRCTVEYEGRAASRLDAGDRHVLLKPDGTVLVHTDEGQKPVNWQPPGCTHDPEIDDGTFLIRSRRESPEERLDVRFERVVQVSTFAVRDERDLDLRGTEADLRERVLENPDLIEEGFTPLSTERDTPAGAVDVFGEDLAGRSVVLELKRRRAGLDAVGQLERYVDALQRDLHADTEVRGILVAPSATDRTRELLAENGLEFVSLEPESEVPTST